MILGIDRKLFIFTKVRYPWPLDNPNSWPVMFKFLVYYAPLTCSKLWEALNTTQMVVINVVEP